MAEVGGERGGSEILRMLKNVRFGVEWCWRQRNTNMKTKKTTTMNWILSGVLGLALAAGMTAPVAQGAEALMEIDKLETLAKNAGTAKEHAEVAKQYRLRAENYIEKAKQHEAKMSELNERPRTAMHYKWPSMVRTQVEKEKQMAMQARRAAAECMALAEKHIQLAVEKQLAA